MAMPMTEMLVSAALGVLAWAGVRLVQKVDALDAKVDRLAEEHASFGATLKNGITASIESMRLELFQHMDGEEERIIRALTRRDPAKRTRESDRGSR